MKEKKAEKIVEWISERYPAIWILEQLHAYTCRQDHHQMLQSYELER